MNTIRISVMVNGVLEEVDVAPNQRLLDVLRDDLRLTGAKEGCGIGECGACTVLLDGLAVNACLVLAAQVDGRTVTTVEGLADANGELSALQAAFLDEGAVQCGFCTPGMLMSASALLQRTEVPTEEEVRTAIAGNLCRCTGYQQNVRAILKAADESKKTS